MARNSNLGHLCNKWAELRKHIIGSSPQAPPPHQDSPTPRSKRSLSAEDIADIVHRYETGETTQQVGNRYGISKTRVAAVLRRRATTTQVSARFTHLIAQVQWMGMEHRIVCWTIELLTHEVRPMAARELG